MRWGIPIPRLLSFLAKHDPNATVEGLDEVPPADRPSNAAVNITRFAFQTMVGIGTALALLGVVFAYVRIRKRRLPESRWFYWAVVAAGPASVVALIAGWVTTEVGRQPWVVYQVMRTSEAVTAGERHPGRLRDARRRLRRARGRRLVGPPPAPPRAARPDRAGAVPVLAPAGFADIPPADDA